MENIRFAKYSDLPVLTKMWQECFGDDESYAEFFYKDRLSGDIVLCQEADGIPVSMLSMLPAEYVYKEQTEKIRYIYGVATIESQRGKGYAGKMLAYALQYLAERGEKAILVPANDGLFEFYGNRGFTSEVYIGEESISIAEVQQGGSSESGFNKKTDYNTEKGVIISGIAESVNIISFGEESWEGYYRLRSSFLKKLSGGYVQLDKAAVKYAVDENAFCGGECIRIETNKGTVAFTGYINKEKKELVIKEFVTDIENICESGMDTVRQILLEYVLTGSGTNKLRKQNALQYKAGNMNDGIHAGNKENICMKQEAEEVVIESIRLRIPPQLATSRKRFALYSGKCNEVIYFNLALDEF